MKKTALCMFLAVVMTLSLTTGAFAEQYPISGLSESEPHKRAFRIGPERTGLSGK